MRLRYMDHPDTDPNMCGDGPGATLKPENLDALAGDSTAHNLMKLPLEERHEILRLQAERIAYGEYIRCAELDVCVQCYTSAPEPDIQRGLCPRCQQLAELEREIGRAVIGLRLMESLLDRLETIAFQREDYRNTAEWKTAEDLGMIENQSDEALDRLIARWRQLHAEGAEAEAEAATERQEGE